MPLNLMSPNNNQVSDIPPALAAAYETQGAAYWREQCLLARAETLAANRTARELRDLSAGLLETIDALQARLAEVEIGALVGA
jgi:hypothetical protein